MGGQQYGAVFRDLADEVAHFHDLVGIEPVRGFVQHHQARAVHNGLGNAHALLVTAPEVAQRAVPEMQHAASFGSFGHRFFHLRFIHQAEVRTVGSGILPP